MIASILRIILLLLPIVALVMWLRWRLKTDRTDEDLSQELFRMRIVVGVMLVVAAAAGISLRLMDESAGEPRTVYIPAKTENGVMVPGRFVPADEAEEETPSQEEPDDEPPQN